MIGPNAGFEFASVGTDNTVRIWDCYSGTQIIEFSSEKDKPSCLCYHPILSILACGYESGYIRFFDTENAITAPEIKVYSTSVLCLCYIYNDHENDVILNDNNNNNHDADDDGSNKKKMSHNSQPIRFLVSINIDGIIIIHNIINDSIYIPFKTINYPFITSNTNIGTKYYNNNSTTTTTATNSNNNYPSSSNTAINSTYNNNNNNNNNNNDNSEINKLYMIVSDDNEMLVIGNTVVASIIIYETSEFNVLYRLSSICGSSSGSANSSPSLNTDNNNNNRNNSNGNNVVYDELMAKTATTAAVATVITPTPNVKNNISSNSGHVNNAEENSTIPYILSTPISNESSPESINERDSKFYSTTNSTISRSRSSSSSSSSSSGSSSKGSTLQAPLLGMCFLHNDDNTNNNCKNNDEHDAYFTINRLLLMTDKHFITLPLRNYYKQSLTHYNSGSNSSNNDNHNNNDNNNNSSNNNRLIVTKKLSLWDNRTTKRIEFGIPVSLSRDDTTGLILIAIRPPVISHTSSSSSSSSMLKKIPQL